MKTARSEIEALWKEARDRHQPYDDFVIASVMAMADVVDAKLSAVDSPSVPDSPPRPGSLWRMGPVKTKDHHIFRDPDDPGTCWLEAGDPSVDSGCEWIRVSDLDAPARPDPVPLLRQTWRALVGLIGHEHVGYSATRAHAEQAADAIAAAYPEVTK
jgi:hypothetical protein